MGECLLQITLPLGRRTRSQARAEPGRLFLVRGAVLQAALEEAREFVANLLEDLLVAPAHGVARPLQRGHVPARVEQPLLSPCSRLAVTTRRGCHLLGRLPSLERRPKPPFEQPGQILLANSLPGLLRRPRCEGTPVGSRSGVCRERRRQLVVTLGDLQVADRRVLYSRNPMHILRRWNNHA